MVNIRLLSITYTRKILDQIAFYILVWHHQKIVSICHVMKHHILSIFHW